MAFKKTIIDPTTVRLSESLLLSDFMGCTSVYRDGLANPIYRQDRKKIDEGRCLAGYLEQLQDVNGPLSVIYGYISPELSRQIVKYQDPDIPSYHRWDLGAAADVSFNNHGYAPVLLAHDIDHDFPRYSRMITYAQSPYICIATKRSEGLIGDTRRSFYENIYIPGRRKPLVRNYPRSIGRRSVVIEESKSYINAPNYDWTGGTSHPPYHLKGIKGYEHLRNAIRIPLSTLLYDKKRVHNGVHNRPPIGDSKRLHAFNQNIWLASLILTRIQQHIGKRMSVISAYKSGEPKYDYQNGCIFTIIPPESLSIGYMIITLTTIFAEYNVYKVTCKLLPGTRKIVITGESNVSH